MSRRVYRLGLGLGLVALTLAFTDWALGLRPGVTEANVRRLRVGMTLEEVEALLGGRAPKDRHPVPGLGLSEVRPGLFLRLSPPFPSSCVTPAAHQATHSGDRPQRPACDRVGCPEEADHGDDCADQFEQDAVPN